MVWCRSLSNCHLFPFRKGVASKHAQEPKPTMHHGGLKCKIKAHALIWTTCHTIPGSRTPTYFTSRVSIVTTTTHESWKCKSSSSRSVTEIGLFAFSRSSRSRSLKKTGRVRLEMFACRRAETTLGQIRNLTGAGNNLVGPESACSLATGRGFHYYYSLRKPETIENRRHSS